MVGVVAFGVIKVAKLLEIELFSPQLAYNEPETTAMELNAVARSAAEVRVGCRLQMGVGRSAFWLIRW